MTWTLILWVFGADSQSLTNVPGFADPVQCELAGAQALVGVTMASVRGEQMHRSTFVCVNISE